MDNSKVTMIGHITIRNKETQEILVDKDNAINFETMSVALGKSLGNKANGPINRMAFGNGGSSIDALGVITYLSTNAIGQNATLYNETYSKIVDDNDVANNDPTENNIVIEHEDSKFYSDIVVTCTLDYNEPSDQTAFDTATSFTDSYVFDEMALKTADDTMITHVIFHPINKSLNRIIEIIYTLRISMQ